MSYKYGYKFAMIEHKLRYLGIKFLLAGLIVAIINSFYKIEPYVVYEWTTNALFGIGIALELLSLGAHLIEKKLMNSIRHRKIKNRVRMK